MNADDRPTCGKGLAANAALPEQLARLLSERAEVLERHTKALDPSDPTAKRELEAYTSLVRTHRDVAAQLAGLARQMADCRDLPMPDHDMRVMTDPDGQAAAFRRLVAAERDLLELLQAKLQQEEPLAR